MNKMAFLNKSNGWYNPGYSYDALKQKNIVFTFLETLNYSETARRQAVSEHCVRECVRRFINSENYLSLPKGHRASKCDDGMTIMLLLLTRLFPTAYLDDYQMMLMYHLDLQADEVPSIGTISRKLKECGMTDKKLSKIYSERFSLENLRNRSAYVQWRQLQEVHTMYFLDETGIYERDGNRARGWSLAGERIIYPQPIKNARKRWNVIAMIGFVEGIINAFPLDVNVTWDVFRQVFETTMLDFIPPGSYLCMDNGSFHKFHELANICARRNVTLVMLPPYSPDYSPIECVFGVVKADLRRSVGRSLENAPAEIMAAFMRVRRATVRSFYLKSWTAT